ncbi:MAG: hypothetical protein KH009_04225 [Clostridiales bacterium]|nr:hypothetical protein [Clostridiales bacterium]
MDQNEKNTGREPEKKKGLEQFELKKVWQWLMYLYILLPLVLFALGFLARGMNMGITFARLYHSYCMYIVNPIPDLPSFTGILGAVIAVIAVFLPLYRRDKWDFLLSIALVALNAFYYYNAFNYLTIRYLTLG